MGKIKNNSQDRKGNPLKGSVVIFITLLLILFGSSLAFGALSQEQKKQVLEKAFKIQMPFVENHGFEIWGQTCLLRFSSNFA